MKRLALLALLWPLASFATDYVNVPLTLEQALARTRQDIPLTCSGLLATATIEFYDSPANLPDHPYYTQTNQPMPVTWTTYTGGVATVYIRVTCADSVQVYRVHYPDSLTPIAPNPPTALTVTP